MHCLHRCGPQVGVAARGCVQRAFGRGLWITIAALCPPLTRCCRFWLLHEGRVQVVSDLGDGLEVLEAPAVLGEGALLQLEDKSFA